MRPPGPRIAALDGGTYYHHAALGDRRFAPYFDAVLYVRELEHADLAAFDAVVVPDRIHPELLRKHAPALLGVAEAGGTLVVFGENEAHDWLPGATWEHRPTDFWWWLEPGADSGLRVASPDHALFRHLSLDDATWHHHGLFHPPEGAEKVVVRAGERSADTILYDDRVSTPGRLVVTSLDPFYHHGSHFMPATTRFLTGFLRWLAAELGRPSRDP